jgi:putative membrane protein
MASPLETTAARAYVPRMIIVLHLAVLAVTILLLSRWVSGVRIRDTGTAVVVAVVFSVLNFFLGWMIRAVLFVPALLTLGLLFLFVPFIVNAALLWLTDKLLRNFEIRNMRSLWISAAVITLVNGLFYAPLLNALANGHDNGGYQRFPLT